MRRNLLPKLISALFEEDYHLRDLRADAIAGLTVAIVALPLAMAIAIASGTTPDKGLITAVVAGFLISALGGARFQIGGPTGAFIVVVYGVIQHHGFDGLVLATMMAGMLLIVAALSGIGDWIRHVPDTVVLGFTAGIAIIIATSQLGDFLGLHLIAPPADFIDKLGALWAARGTLSASALGIGSSALLLIALIQRFTPRAPAFLIAVGLTAAASIALQLPVESIGSRFGGLPSTLPAPSWPVVTWDRVRELALPALTIAFLAGIESLLSARVADNMTGRRHRSNGELMAQGVANIAAGLFGGIAATGAIARTATNIRAGARSPVAGMLHAAFLLLFMLLFGPLLSYVPLCSLAAVLLVVAWQMCEHERLYAVCKGPRSARAVLLLTLVLTVLVDLTIAIVAGLVFAALLARAARVRHIVVRRKSLPMRKQFTARQ